MNGKTIILEPEYLKTLKSLLRQFLPENCEVFVFGSRAGGIVKKFSDIDIALKIKGQKIDDKIIYRLKDNFVNSRLPYKVDIIDLNNIDENFKKIIEPQLIKINN